MRNYFYGWYYRQQTENQTLAVIPSFHQSEHGRFCAIQIITDEDSFYVPFDNMDMQKSRRQWHIAGNQFGMDGFSLDVATPEVNAKGALRFYNLTPLRYDIMGPFRYIPFLQCRHSIYSMRHKVDGTITVNGIPYVFQNHAGYMEGDRGSSFPKNYVWTACSFPEGAIMLSIADIPMGGLHFTGIIGIVLLAGREYRIATYLGAKAEIISREAIIVRQGRYRLTVRPGTISGHPLRAPVAGDMQRIIREQPACTVSYCFSCGEEPILELEAANAALEYEY